MLDVNPQNYTDTDDRITRFIETAVPKRNIHVELQAIAKTLLITPDAVRKAISKSHNIVYKGIKIRTFKVHKRVLIDFESLYYFAVQENWNLYALTALGIEHNWFCEPLENGGERLYREIRRYLADILYEDPGNAYNNRRQTADIFLGAVRQGTGYIAELEQERKKISRLQEQLQKVVHKYAEMAAEITGSTLTLEDGLYDDEKAALEVLEIYLGGHKKEDDYYWDEEDMYSSETAYLQAVSEIYHVAGKKNRREDKDSKIVYLILQDTKLFQVFEDWEEADDQLDMLTGFFTEAEEKEEKTKRKRGLQVIEPMESETYCIYTQHAVDINSYEPGDEIILNNGYIVKCRDILQILP